MDAILLIQLAQIILIAAIAGVLLKKFVPHSLLSYIIAGIVIGPLFLGSSFIQNLIGIPALGISELSEQLLLFSQLGTALLLFTIGAETSLKMLMKTGKEVLPGTIFQVMGIIVITIIVTFFMGLNTGQGLVIGTILAFSSTMLVVKILSDKKQAESVAGRFMISILLLQDFMVLFFVPIISNMNSLGFEEIISLIARSAVIILLGVVAAKIVPKIVAMIGNEYDLFLMVSSAIAFIFIGVSILLSIPASIGAFIGGASISSTHYGTEIATRLKAIREFFLTIFFVTLGIQLSSGIGGINLSLLIAMLLIVFIAKPILIMIVSMFAGYGMRVGLKAGGYLSQCSEFGFELAMLASLSVSGTALLDKGLFATTIAVITISMALTPYLTNSKNYFLRKIITRTREILSEFDKGHFCRKINALEKINSKKILKEHIIIIGGGTIGRGLASGLAKTNNIVVIDHDPEVVEEANAVGLNYVCASTENEEIWNKVDLLNSKLMIVTILKHKEAVETIKQALQRNPKIKIFALAHYFTDALEFYKLGVHFVAMPSILGSNAFLEKIIHEVEGKKESTGPKSAYLAYLEEKAIEEKTHLKKPIHETF